MFSVLRGGVHLEFSFSRTSVLRWPLRPHFLSKLSQISFKWNFSVFLRFLQNLHFSYFQPIRGIPPVKKKFSKFFRKKLGFLKNYKSAKSPYFFKISKPRVKMARASTKLSNRILIFGPKNFWRASECNHAARLHSDAEFYHLSFKTSLVKKYWKILGVSGIPRKRLHGHFKPS